MSTISVCLIVKNESLVLDRCLTCVSKFADEIIVVDTGSTDNTVDIAGRYTSNVHTIMWQDDFADARNTSFSYATSDYIMWLDADDVITDNNIDKIIQLKKNMTADMYMMRYNVGFDGEVVTSSFYRERIVKRSNNYKWHGCVHECITPSGNVQYVDIAINHNKLKEYDKDRNINIYENIKKSRKLDARETYYYARELYYHARYKECVHVMRKFFRMNGFVENIIDGHIVVANCYIMLHQYTCALHELYVTFDYDAPRANVCCRLADIHMLHKNYNLALFWYDVATKCAVVDKKGGFVQNDCYNYYPYIQMCVCYYNLHNIPKAIECNELAGHYKPNDKAYLSNKAYFEKITKV